MPPTDSLKDPAVAIAEMYRSLIPDIGGSLKEITNIENEKYVLPSAMLTNVFGFHRNVTKTYRFGRKLGEGAYAFVVKARNVYTGRSVAVKILDKVWQKKNNRPATVRFIRRMSEEIACLSRMAGDLCSVDVHGLYEDSRYVYIVMDYLRGGEIGRMIKDGPVGEDIASICIYQMLWQMREWHTKGFMHTDVNSLNFLFVSARKSDLWLKSLDFGLAQILRDNMTNCTGDANTMLTRRRGTPIYTAPEVILKCYDAKADIWSIGVLAFQMMLGRMPFVETASKLRELNKTQIFDKIAEGGQLYTDGMEDFDALSPLARDFLRGLLSFFPNHRPSAAQALEHPWLNRSAVTTYLLGHPVLRSLVSSSGAHAEGANQPSLQEARMAV
ncbi:hypothetical protein AAMO2058_000015600 [Amorphochlora amoebiformis]